MTAPAVSVCSVTSFPGATEPGTGLAVTSAQADKTSVVSPTATWVAAVREVPSREKVSWPTPGNLPLRVRVALPSSSVVTWVTVALFCFTSNK